MRSYIMYQMAREGTLSPSFKTRSLWCNNKTTLYGPILLMDVGAKNTRCLILNVVEAFKNTWAIDHSLS